MKISLAFFCVLLFLSGYSQKKQASTPVQKKPLTHTVYDSWKEITFRSITNDGSAAAFTVNPQDGDGKVIFYNLKTNTQDSVKRAAEIDLTWDSQLAIFKIKPQQKLVKDLRRQKKKKEDLPKDSLGIYSFATRKTERIPEVKSYSIPEKSGGWVAYQLEAKKEEKAKPADKAGKTDSTKKAAPAKSKKIKKNSEDNGYTLVLRKLSDNRSISFGYVKEYTFAKFGQGLLFASTGNDSTMKAGVYWYDLQTEKLQSLYEGKSKYKMKGLAVSEDGSQTAFLVDSDTTKAQIRHFSLYYWKKGEPAASLLDAEHAQAFPTNWIVSEHYTPLFSKDGSRLFFGSSPQPVVQDTTLLTEEIVNVEVWTGDDEYIYPQQNKQLDTEKKRSYLTMIDLTNKTITPLARQDVPTIDLADEGNAAAALGETNKPYRKMTTWDPSA